MEQQQVNILQFPDLILKKVFKNVPNRWSASRTCKKFYRIVCDIEKFKYQIKVKYIDERLKKVMTYFSGLITDKLIFSFF